MYSAIFSIAVDPSLGRLDYNLLPDQALMEMLIDGFDEESKEDYQDDHCMYIDVCEWPCVECDENQRVVEIGATDDLNGSLQLSFIPATVKKFEMPWNQLTGSADIAQLPEGMEMLSLNNNGLRGTLDFAHLPGSMRRIALHCNDFTGSLVLTQLPGNMKFLYLDSNHFTGSVDLSQLPESMKLLYISNNQLTGAFIATNLSESIEKIYAHLNNFEKIASVDSKTNARILLGESGVKSVIDENGSKKGLDLKRVTYMEYRME